MGGRGGGGYQRQPLPDEPISPEMAATVAMRGGVLEGLGMKATTKRQV